MLNLTKAVKETVYIKIIRVFLAMIFLVVPLIFFTDLTANPFFAQNTLLYVLVALIYGTLAVKFYALKTLILPKPSLIWLSLFMCLPVWWGGCRLFRRPRRPSGRLCFTVC